MSKEVLTEDFLNEDVEIPSQKFVCVSILKPTAVVQRKQLFLLHKPIGPVHKDFQPV